MPTLKFSAVESKKICSISKSLVDELQMLLDCPRDYFNIESVQSVFIKDGEYVDGYPFVEISWFDRGQELQDKVAEIVTRYVHSLGYDDVDVIFTILQKERYYENGKHF
jgi:hypothetical protein